MKCSSFLPLRSGPFFAEYKIQYASKYSGEIAPERNQEHFWWLEVELSSPKCNLHDTDIHSSVSYSGLPLQPEEKNRNL